MAPTGLPVGAGDSHVGEGSPRLLTARLRLRKASGADLLLFWARLVGGPSRVRGSGRPDEDWHFDPTGTIRAGLDRTDEVRSWLAIEDRETLDLVGLAELLLPAPDGLPWIGLLVIESARRNRGLGGEVVVALERWLAARGWTELRLTVALTNSDAQRFWERHGYRELPNAWRCYDGLAPTSVVRSKALSPRVAGPAPSLIA